MRSTVIFGLFFIVLGWQLLRKSPYLGAAALFLLIGFAAMAYWFFFERGNGPDSHIEPDDSDVLKSTSKRAPKYAIATSRKTPLPRFAEEAQVPLGSAVFGSAQQLLRKLRESGIEFVCQVDSELETQFDPNEAVTALQTLAGINDEEKNYTRNLWALDTECIAGTEDFASVAEQAIALSGEKLRRSLSDLKAGAEIDASAWLKFQFRGDRVQIVLEQNNDWLDADLFVWLQHYLKKVEPLKRFVYYPTNDQSMLVGCVTVEAVGKLRQNGLNFVPFPG